MQPNVSAGAGGWGVGIFGGQSDRGEDVSPGLEELSVWDPWLSSAPGLGSCFLCDRPSQGLDQAWGYMGARRPTSC